MPGERLRGRSGRSGSLSEADLASAEVFTLDDLGETVVGEGVETAETVDGAADGAEGRDDAGRRRRRRGGRGRGRGRGRDDVPAAAGDVNVEGFATDEEDDEEEIPVEAPRPPRSTPFGSVWDSQLGTTAAPSSLTPPPSDDEDFDEPEIPEYLIAEQRRGRAPGGGGRGGARGGPRGGRAAYQSAIERERYGRGGGGGINRYPDVSGRTGGRDQRSGGRGYDRPNERPREASRPSGSAEPWSEVPPELEAMLRAQVGQKPTRPTEVVPGRSVEDEVVSTAAGDVAEAAEAAPKRRSTRSSSSTSRATKAADTAETATPKRRTTRKPAASAEATADGEVAEATAPKRRTTRKSATAATADAPSTDGPSADADAGAEAAPKRRTTRKTTKTTT
jgi:hypothetical protein